MKKELILIFLYEYHISRKISLIYIDIISKEDIFGRKKSDWKKRNFIIIFFHRSTETYMRIYCRNFVIIPLLLFEFAYSLFNFFFICMILIYLCILKILNIIPWTFYINQLGRIFGTGCIINLVSEVFINFTQFDLD